MSSASEIVIPTMPRYDDKDDKGDDDSSPCSSTSSDNDVGIDDNKDLSSITRAESFLERQEFADGESEAGETTVTAKTTKTTSGAVAVPNEDVVSSCRRRRGSRSSRTNSCSEARRHNNKGSVSPAATAAAEGASLGGSVSGGSSSDEDEAGAATASNEDLHLLGSGNGGSNKVKRRKKRKRHVEDSERALKVKMAEIEQALAQENEGGPARLRALAVSEGGLLDDDIRRRVWPRLLNIRLLETEVLPSQEDCEAHPEYGQVVMDVVRSLKRFPPGISEEARPELQDQLTRLIVRVLLKHRHLHYYQGYHDVAITFLLVVGEEMGYHILQRLSLSHLKEFMAPTMENTTFMLNYIYPMISRENPELHDFLDASEVGTIFALSWMITWFAHVLPNYEDVVRLYDFFLSKPPLMPMYLAAALVLHRHQEVLMCECDLAMVHSLLSRIPVDLPFEKLLVSAQDLYDRFPPESLEYDVKLRVKRLQALNGPRRNRVRHPPASNLGLPVAVGIAAVTVPVVIGIAVWKYYHS